MCASKLGMRRTDRLDRSTQVEVTWITVTANQSLHNTCCVNVWVPSGRIEQWQNQGLREAGNVGRQPMSEAGWNNSQSRVADGRASRIALTMQRGPSGATFPQICSPANLIRVTGVPLLFLHQPGSFTPSRVKALVDSADDAWVLR